MPIVLRPAVIPMGKKSNSPSRQGYVDEKNQTYLPPKSDKRASAWKDRMRLDKAASFKGE